MQVYFCADAHLGHKNIHKFRDVESSEENTERWMEEAWRKLNKRTVTYYLGDVAFDDEHLLLVQGFPGRKILIGGNHEDHTFFKARTETFEEIHGMIKYKEFWLTHAPIHPQELRGKKNIHGHCHSDTIPDKRYFNACPEAIGRYFISLQEVRAILNHNQ